MEREEQEKGLVVADSVPKFEISIEESQKRLKDMRRFIAEQMVNGVDYAPIPGTNGKPTLLKPGAEKLNQIFGFYPEFCKLNEVMDHDKQFYYVEYKCVLKSKKTGVKQAEGIGSCNNKEKAKMSVDMYSQMNTINKVSQKRAYMAATLMATALSQQYNQDLDDDDEVVVKPIQTATQNCSKCNKPINEKTAKYSADKYGNFFCFNCQKDEKELS